MKNENVIRKTVIGNLRARNANNRNIYAFESFGRKITYGEFFEIVDMHAKAFYDLGVKKGDIVTFCTAGTVDVIAMFYALNQIGAVGQLVNPNHFKFNSQKYIDDTGSKILIMLDRFYVKLKNAVEITSVENVILVSITEYASAIYKLLARNKPIDKSMYIDCVDFWTYREFCKIGKRSTTLLPFNEYEQGMPAAICYTSGTTGEPKGVILTNESFNNMISIYDQKDGFGISAGDRNLVLIPIAHVTGLCHCINAPLALGCTNVIQPIYNPKTFVKDIKKAKPNIVMASVSHYANLLENDLKDGTLDFLEFCFCGGEALPEKFAMDVNKELHRLGVSENMIIGYGMSEFAAMTMFNMGIEERTNESGTLMPGVEAKIVHPITGEPSKVGEIGLLKIYSPCAMLGYYNMPKSTEKFFEYDEDGRRWGNTGDYATVDENGVYRVLGRATDSFVTEDDEVVYLFNIENFIASFEYVKECEVVAVTINGKKVPVVHIVPYKSCRDIDALLKEIDFECRKKFSPESIPYAYKIRESFPISPISSKRDFETIKYETEDFKFVIVNEDDEFKIVDVTLDPAEATKYDEIELFKNINIRV